MTVHTPKVSLCDASEINEICMTGIVGTENRSYRNLNCINYSSLPVHQTCFLHTEKDCKWLTPNLVSPPRKQLS